MHAGTPASSCVCVCVYACMRMDQILKGAALLVSPGANVIVNDKAPGGFVSSIMGNQ